ncbi:MFS transporter [Planctomycetales bacterium 10988]|nr:MFS transporter [Planctomycetales bacterium 10988]
MSAEKIKQNRKRFSIYYGWVIVVLAAIAMAATLPGRTHGLGLITKRLLEDLHLSPANFAWMNVIATLIGAAFCLPCGWMIDRYGIRRVCGMVFLLLALAVLGLSSISDTRILLILLTFTRGFGQSMLSVVSITMVGKWFHRRIGPAMGVYSVLLSLLMAAGTGLLGSEIIRVGWREAWASQGWILLCCVPFMFLLVRSQPRDFSIEFQTKHEASSSTCQPVGATLVQALLTPCFWMFALSISFFGLISSGLSLFNQYVLEERGFSEEVFHSVLVIGLLFGMLANLGAGWLSKKISLEKLLCFSMLLLAGTLFCFPFVQTIFQVYAYAAVKGIAGGILTVLFFAVWSHGYGTTQLGRIQAAAQMLTVLFSAVGPIFVESSRNYTGSYMQVFFLAAGISASFGVLAWFTQVPSVARGDWQEKNSEDNLSNLTHTEISGNLQ